MFKSNLNGPLSGIRKGIICLHGGGGAKWHSCPTLKNGGGADPSCPPPHHRRPSLLVCNTVQDVFLMRVFILLLIHEFGLISKASDIAEYVQVNQYYVHDFSQVICREQT